MKPGTCAWGIAIGVVCVSAASGSAASQNPGPLYALQRFAVGSASPFALTSADWNGDGHLDFATVSTTSSTVELLRGLGDGTFELQSPIVNGAAGQELVPGDFDADGWSDVAVASFDGVWTSHSLGPHGFALPAQHIAGSPARGIATADMDGDGDLDLTAALAIPDGVATLLGNGDGSFQTPLVSTSGPTPRAIALGDLDGDAVVDAVVAHDPNPLFSVMIGRGNGTFEEPPAIYPVSGYPYASAIADIDLDGDLDAAIGHYFGLTSIAYNDGAGAFALAPYVPSGIGDSSGFLLADLDADGDPELVMPRATSPARVYENQGGSFALAQELQVTGRDVAAGDWNGDGALDLALPDLAGFGGTVVTVLGKGALAFDACPHYPIPGTWSSWAEVVSLDAADLDGDAQPDLVGSRQSIESATLWFNQGGGVLGPAQLLDMQASRGFAKAPDLDQDGRADLVLSDGQQPQSIPTVCVRLGLGGGAFAPVASFTGAGSGKAGQLALGDLDGDGDTDLAVSSTNSGNIAVFLGDGAGALLAGASYFVPGGLISLLDGRPTHLADFDLDGKLDLLYSVPAGSGSGALAVLLGAGDGTLGPANLTPLPDSLQYLGQAAVAADLDLDGDPDVAVAGFAGPTFVYEAQGAPTFGAPIVLSTSVGVSRVGDVNGDGWPDLVSQGLRGVHPGQGGLVFGTPLQYTQLPKSGNEDTALADFDGNGALDVASADVFVILNRHQPPLVTAIDGLFAGTAGSVAITGAWLGAGSSVSVGGAPVPVLSGTPTGLVVQLGTSAPGFHDLAVANALGTSALADGLARWPALAAGQAILGQPLEIELANGTSGLYVLGISATTMPPLALPGIWHQLELALPALLKTGAFTAANPQAFVSLQIPNDPALSGATVHAQAWALQGDPAGGYTQSFSNLEAIAIQ